MKTLIKLGLAAVAAMAIGVAAQTTRPHPPKPPFPQIELPQSARGAQALQLLGSRLPEVAAWYGKTPTEFASILRRDRMAIIDRKGRMFYQEEVLPATGSVDSLTSTGALVSLDQTFKLHSKPGSKRTIYLNFVGATLTNTVWNSNGNTITAQPFDLDGVPYSMSTAELERIQYIWQRVAEDYAAFDVDVTTEPPAAGALTRSGSADDVFGTMVLITPRTFYSCSCGGVAYVGVFDDTSDFYKPALVFSDALSGNEKYIAEAVSHEAGHNMGLHHDGTSTSGYYTGHGDGATGWAPIMGAGYYKAVVQWSKGEYPDANNKEDDFAVMATNGLPLRADDHGNSISTATRLAGSTANGITTVKGAGIIEKAGDVDVFSLLAAAGTISINVNPSARSGNVDLYAELLNGSGQVIASSNPTDALNATLTANVSGGTYYVAVRGTSKGDLTTGYSSYGSVGEYSVSGTVPASASQPPTASFTVSTTSGYAPLAVNFNGSASSDPDGTIVAYQWLFGDGTSATGATASKSYSTPGTYTATLNVTDNAGLTGSKSVVITVQSPTSQPPVASVSASTYSGVAPLPVTFYSNGSYDPEGGALSYAWNFGDNSTGSGATASHTYSVPGTYAATLTVTDNTGLTSSKSVTISVTSTNAVSSTQMYATVSVTLSTNKGGQTQAIAYVTVKDANGKAISGASVTGNWSGAVSGTATATTGTTGVAAVTSSRTKATGSFTFTVTNVTLSGYTFAGSSSGSAVR